jgi:hypothetical protein
MFLSVDFLTISLLSSIPPDELLKLHDLSTGTDRKEWSLGSGRRAPNGLDSDLTQHPHTWEWISEWQQQVEAKFDCSCVHMSMSIHVCMRMYVYVYVYVYVLVHMCKCVCMRARVCVCVCMCVYKHNPAK